MPVAFFQQPFDDRGAPSRFGDLLKAKLASGKFTSAAICSAYASTGGTGPIAGAISAFTASGRQLSVILGLGNGVTSKQAVEHLLLAGATVHGIATGALFIFHSKVYLLESATRAWLALGSCNLTGEGLYRNFETMTFSDLDLANPTDKIIHSAVQNWLGQLATYSGNYLALAQPNLRSFVASRLLIDETSGGGAQQAAVTRAAAARAKSGVPAIRVPPPPAPAPGFSKPRRARGGASPSPARGQPILRVPARGALVWEKPSLPASDAQRTGGPSTKPVGGLRLTRAGFQVAGQIIDQTTYFRKLFNAFPWRQPARPRTEAKQEEADVPFDVTILANRIGLQTLTVSHKPSGEAGQGNYTTIIHWGPLAQLLRSAINIQGKTVRLYAPPSGTQSPFFLEVI